MGNRLNPFTERDLDVSPPSSGLPISVEQITSSQREALWMYLYLAAGWSYHFIFCVSHAEHPVFINTRAQTEC